MLGEKPIAVLGAVLAGGQAIRFGQDKLAVPLDGTTLLQSAYDALAGQVDETVVCGREMTVGLAIPDWPTSELGPLGGLCAAMRYAANNRFNYVLSVPADTYPVPLNLRELLASDTPAVFTHHWLFGFWPIALFSALEAYLVNGQRSVRGWLDESDPRRIDDSLLNLTNVNTVPDLKALTAGLATNNGSR